MINCLFDYIGLLDVTTSKSGTYLNRLQGIDTNQLDLIRNNETYNIEDAWDDIQNRAIEEFEQRISEWATKYYRNRSYVANIVTGQYDTNDSISTSNNYAGWLFDGTYGYYKNMRLVIQDVHLYSTGTVQSDITIFNAVTGDTLETISYTFIEGINRVPIGKTFAAWEYPKIFIAYNENDVSTIKASDLIYQNTFSTSEGRIGVGSTVLADSINDVGSSGQGLIVSYNIECSIDNWVCQRLDLFRSPFLYLLGYEFCQERLYSDRINRYTLLNRDRAKELGDYFLNRFNTQIKETLSALSIDYGRDYCFACERDVNYKTLLP